MATQIERSSLDLRYQDFRLKQTALEERLISSIAQLGIQEPLEGVEAQPRPILLNGFKRYRCACKLHLHLVPFTPLGPDEAGAILNLLRIANHRALGILEQAAFLEELQRTRHLSIAQLAQELSRSKSWVSMRLALLAELSAPVRAQPFSGAFPVYAWMYRVRPFMRMNGVRAEQVEQFVAAVSGKGLSVRDLELLSKGYFRGPESFRQEILKGNLALPLQRMKQIPQSPDACSEFERVLLGDLEIIQKYMQRVMLGGRSWCHAGGIGMHRPKPGAF